MKNHSLSTNASAFEKFANNVTRLTGSTPAFIIAFTIILIWLITGPFFHYSDTWQLVINTGTTIITFLMVFLIQKTQNKDSIALQLKLNELVAASETASNRLVNVEDLSEDELRLLVRYYRELAKMSKKDHDLHKSHTIEEAEELHAKKMKLSKGKKSGIK